MANLTNTIPMPILIAGIAVLIIVFYVLWSVIDVNRKRKKCQAYMDRFTELYDKERNIRTVLETMRNEYKTSDPERKAINRGLHYLEKSLYGDYEGALNQISSALKSVRIKEVHDRILVMEEQKLTEETEKKDAATDTDADMISGDDTMDQSKDQADAGVDFNE